ncbi:GNAT family N-acetyltransferase [Aestuariivita sp.]|jgi:GNAT superfamily N-acetyltransferase|uniref:GNAT family N-acetyltransferase n=1 Tax=Aestuariivita sp. TaxID=1872407 RepID=UPI00216BF36B|nr:GNAT family N-acetyltransferase [Aestuariivita sp.]MCE8009768.1 GNAT family N-acetyltransferase [Aestuariivita sp.]
MTCLRQPTDSELPALSALCLRSKAVWGYDAAFLEACRDELSLGPDDIEQTALIVLEDTGVVIGVAQVAVGPKDAELWKLFVDPDHMGVGHGRRLMVWALDAARATGRSRLLIEADPGALPFYRRFGAAQIGEVASGSIPGRALPLLAVVL